MSPRPRPLGASLPDTPATRTIAGVLTVALLGSILAPARKLGPDQGRVRDSFPFSHYPMFSARRKEHYWVTHLLGITADGQQRPLHYSYAGTGGLNAVRRQLRRRVNDGEGKRLARRAARRIASREHAEDRDIVEVHVVKGRYLIEPFMRGAGEEEFTSRLRVKGRAAVPGRGDASGRGDVPGRGDAPSRAADEEGAR